MVGSSNMMDTTKTKQVNFRIDTETYRFLELLSRIEGNTVTGLCRNLVEESVTQSQDDPKAIDRIRELVEQDLAFVGGLKQ